MNIINGKQIQEEKIKDFSNQIESINDTIKLTVIQVGNNEASKY